MGNSSGDMGDWEAVQPFLLEALDALPDQVWFMTPDLQRVLFSSRSFEEMYGLPLDELYRDPASPLALTDDDDTGEIARALDTGRPSRLPSECEYTVRRPDGTERILRLRTIPLTDDDGRLRVVAGITEDITDRVGHEREIDRLRGFSHMILDSTGDHVALIDADDRVLYVNQALRDATDLDADPAGRPTSELLASRIPVLPELVARVRSDGRARSLSWHETTSDRWLETTVTPIADSILSVSVDRTAQRRAEAHERQLIEAANRADRLDALGRMASGIAHDVGNLTRLVLSGLDDLRNDLRNGDDPAAALADATHAAERALAITHQLLAFSRGTEGPPRPVNVDAIVARMEALVGQTLGVDVDVEVVTRTSGALVMSDEARLEQVVLNLATNAHAAMPDGGRFAIVTSVTEGRGPGECPILTLSASDTGCGMSPATIERAFEPFFTTDEVHGTGLGLASVYATAVDAGGTAHISSAPGEGTCVTVELPVIASEAAGSATSILLVDTFGPDSDATLEALTGGGYDVRRKTPSRIVAELDRSPGRYRAIVLDPLADDGALSSLFDQVTALHPSMPVVLLSKPASQTETVDLETVHVVQPPFGRDELLQTIRSAVAPGDG